MTKSIKQENENEQTSQKSNEGLSEENKKANHIASEKRRRNAIKEQFDRLSEIVPNLDEIKSKSEATVLKETVNYLKNLLEENKQLREYCKQNSISLEWDENTNV